MREFALLTNLSTYQVQLPINIARSKAQSLKRRAKRKDAGGVASVAAVPEDVQPAPAEQAPVPTNSPTVACALPLTLEIFPDGL
jgi:hypothetical protein